ncbi:MAG: prepilin-type N-terminal cleavage/methylation domain-containing protein [Gammaproteobacteria bacterium]|nr:prepilin-type N-terminal cleavage/methylation domain-containing protein [Gammaproteobacteria bacterium]
MSQKQQFGFTLIELMIVVAIVAILSIVGAGFYGDYVISSNRTEARGALTRTAGSLEKCRSLYGAYSNGSCNVTLPFDTETNYYEISGIPGTSSFSLVATPKVGSPQANDDNCKTLTLTNTGLKDATGVDTSDCW